MMVCRPKHCNGNGGLCVDPLLILLPVEKTQVTYTENVIWKNRCWKSHLGPRRNNHTPILTPPPQDTFWGDFKNFMNTSKEMLET